jgi:8-amino-7-oxononanoate synthase
MESEQWDRLIRRRLERLADRHLLRRRHVARPVDATHVEIDGRRYVNFATNNYLGLSHHPRVLQAAADAVRTEGSGAGASPLVTGHGPAHDAAERRIAEWKGTGSAVLLPSGYQANLAAVQTVAALAPEEGGGVRFLLDKLVHASLIDAVRETGAPMRVFPHNHLDKLARLLGEAEPDQVQVVVTESIFSMDGDAADLRGLADLKRRRPFVLLLDEAHGSGVYGTHGAGLAAELGLTADQSGSRAMVDVTVVTLSKALGCAGGAVCGTSAFCDAVVNLGRAYIYSTAVAPAAAAAASAAIDVLRDEPHRQRRLRELAVRVRQRLRAAGKDVPAGESPIIPIVLGNEEAALAAASRMREAGLWVVAIRPPTVPRGTSRLRVTLSSEHTDDEVEQLLAGVARLDPHGTGSAEGRRL